MSTELPPDLPSVADDLYGLDPGEFTAARSERSRAAREVGNAELARQIASLRKPAVAAWAVNLLVRRRRAEVQRLLALAERIREGGDDPAELREHSRAAQRVVTAVTRLAGEIAAEHGRTLSAALTDHVRQTLRAAMADPAAAAAVLSGRLITPLEASAMAGMGAGAGDMSGAVAIPVSVTSLAAHGRTLDKAGDERRRPQQVELARSTRDQAEQEAARAAQEARDARDAANALRRNRDMLAGQVDTARQELRRQEQRLAEVREKLSSADHARRELDEQARVARREADAAEAALEALLEPDQS